MAASSWFALVMGLSIFFGVAGLIMGIVGSVLYAGESYDQRVMTNSTCLTTNYDIIATVCGSKYRYTCYYPMWYVNYLTVENQSVTTVVYSDNRSSLPNANLEGASRLGQNAPCYYDTTNLARCRFSQPNPTPGLIVLIIGWILFGLCGIGLAVFLFIMCSA